MSSSLFYRLFVCSFMALKKNTSESSSPKLHHRALKYTTVTVFHTVRTVFHTAVRLGTVGTVFQRVRALSKTTGKKRSTVLNKSYTPEGAFSKLLSADCMRESSRVKSYSLTSIFYALSPHVAQERSQVFSERKGKSRRSEMHISPSEKIWSKRLQESPEVRLGRGQKRICSLREIGSASGQSGKKPFGRGNVGDTPICANDKQKVRWPLLQLPPRTPRGSVPTTTQVGQKEAEACQCVREMVRRMGCIAENCVYHDYVQPIKGVLSN